MVLLSRSWRRRVVSSAISVKMQFCMAVVFKPHFWVQWRQNVCW